MPSTHPVKIVIIQFYCVMVVSLSLIKLSHSILLTINQQLITPRFIARYRSFKKITPSSNFVCSSLTTHCKPIAAGILYSYTGASFQSSSSHVNIGRTAASNSITDSHHIAMSGLSPVRLASYVEVLFEDDHLIALNKPANMLSVPGRKAWENSKRKARTEEWADALRAAAMTARATGRIECENALLRCTERDNIPRKKQKFLDYLQRILKISSEEVRNTSWDLVVLEDEQRTCIDLNVLPEELLSCADVAQIKSNLSKVFHVHRLDLETSGVIVFAKTEESAAALCKQFQDRHVSIN